MREKRKSSTGAKAELHRALATNFRDNGDLRRALDECNYAIESDTSYAEAYFTRATIYHAMSQLSQAIADYSTAINLRPDLFEAYSARGVAYTSIGQYRSAFDDFQSAIEEAPDDATAYFNRANLCISLGDYDKAIDDLRVCLSIRQDPLYYWHLGHALYQNKAFEEAMENLSAASLFDSEYKNMISFGRGLCFMSMNCPESAVDEFTNVLARFPRFANAYFQRGLAHLRCGNEAKARCDLLKAADLDPQIRETHSAMFDALEDIICCHSHANPGLDSTAFVDRWGILKSTPQNMYFGVH